MKELGKRVRAARLKRGWTLTYLAGRVERSHGWLHSLEKGIGNPPPEVLTGLAEALDEDPREYLRLAGRVALTAAEIVPISPLPRAMSEAIERIVAAQMKPVLERLDELVKLLEAPPPKSTLARAAVSAKREGQRRGRTPARSNPESPAPTPGQPPRENGAQP